MIIIAIMNAETCSLIDPTSQYKKDRDVGDERRIAQVRRHNEGSKKDCGDSARDGKKISKVWPICGRKFELSHSGSNQ